MRTNLFILGIWAAAALATASCAKEKEADAYVTEADGGIRFEIVACSSDTKTVNDGLSTRWAEGDAVNVFHAVAGSKDYINDGEFTLSDAENGKFIGSLASALDPSQPYDWYVYYPYNPEITSPENTSGGYSTVAAFTQSQDGDKGMAMAHLAGLPLAGKSTTEAGGTNPVVSMKNLAAVIKVEVTNNSGANLPVKSVAFTSPVNIAGDYSVNFEDPANPVYTGRPEGVGSCATLNTAVSTLKADQSTYFIAVKPFEAGASETLKLTVNDYEKTVLLDSHRTFEAGTVYTFNFNYDRPEKKRVVCWGSSSTQGQYTYTTHLQEMLGDEWEVYNGGVSGQRSYEIAARQGSVPIVTGSAFTIPAKTTTITIDGVLRTHNIFGDSGYYNIRRFSGLLTNPCKLIGTNGEEVLCNITSRESISGTDTTYSATLRRVTAGQPVEIAEHTPIETYAARELRDADLILLQIGANGSYGKEGEEGKDYGPGLDNLIEQHWEMINYANSNYIVVGFQNREHMERWNYSEKMEQAFQDQFLNMRTEVINDRETCIHWLLESSAYADESEIPESELQRAQEGHWPRALEISVSDRHPNDRGCYVMAAVIYNRMKDLGYLD